MDAKPLFLACLWNISMCNRVRTFVWLCACFRVCRGLKNGHCFRYLYHLLFPPLPTPCLCICSQQQVPRGVPSIRPPWLWSVSSAAWSAWCIPLTCPAASQYGWFYTFQSTSSLTVSLFSRLTVKSSPSFPHLKGTWSIYMTSDWIPLQWHSNCYLFSLLFQ